MFDSEKIQFFYSTVVEFIEKGIIENKYFYNGSIFKNDRNDEFISKVMQDYILNACIEFVSTPDGFRLYSHFMNSSYIDTSRVYVVKEIVRMVTFSYYKDLVEETGSIDINMDISNLNISDCTIKNLKKKLSVPEDVVRLKHIINITPDDFLDWNYRGGSNKKEIKDLIAFCNNIYCIFVNNLVKSKYANSKELLIKINNLEERYSTIQTRKLELENEEQNIIDEIKKLKNELLEFNSVNQEISLQRKR